MKVLRDLTLGRYMPGDSSVHQLDPRAKLVACLFSVITVFLPMQTRGVAWAWPLLAFGVWGSGIPVRRFVRGIKPFFWLFVFTAVLHGLTVPGHRLVSLPLVAVEVTREGCARGAWVSAQLATAIAFSSLLTLTTSPEDLVWAMAWLATPLTRLGIPVGDFCVALLLGLQSLSILGREADRVVGTLREQETGAARGGLGERVRNRASLLVALFRETFQQAEDRVAAALPNLEPNRDGAARQPRRLGGREAVAVGGALLGMGVAVGFGLHR